LVQAFAWLLGERISIVTLDIVNALRDELP
jgi:hypothetical protein